MHDTVKLDPSLREMGGYQTTKFDLTFLYQKKKQREKVFCIIRKAHVWYKDTPCK